MLFPKADLDKIVQINDMFRIDASRSFTTLSIEDLTEVNIYPDFDTDPLIVFNVVSEPVDCWNLDWAYRAAGSKTVKVEMKSATETEEVTYTIEAITEADDMLFSDDSMIYAYESELSRYLPKGRNSWKYLHRKAQEDMLDYLYRNGKMNPDGSQITKDQIIKDKLDKWSTFETILLIFQDVKISNSEAFNEKLTDYSEKRNNARERYIIQYDSNRDGEVNEDDTPIGTRAKFLSR